MMTCAVTTVSAAGGGWETGMPAMLSGKHDVLTLSI